MTENKLQERSYYSAVGEEEYKKYCLSQIKRHSRKADKKRTAGEYLYCFANIENLLCKNFRMLCLGTRNNHEKHVFQNVSSGLNGEVYSQDLASGSHADYIGDFNVLSEFVPHDWDVVYSNAIDHALDAKAVFFEWLKVVKQGGIMVLGFSFDDDISAIDCNSFTYNGVDDFMMHKSELFEYIRSFKAIDYYYWVVRKK